MTTTAQHVRLPQVSWLAFLALRARNPRARYRYPTRSDFVCLHLFPSFLRVNDMLGGMSHSTEGVIAWEFQHPSFQRDRSELLANIKRKSSKTNSSTPSDSPVTRKSALSSSSSGGSGRPTSSRERRLSESVKLEPESMPQEPLPPTFAPSYRASGVPMPDFAYAARDPGPPRMSGSREGGRPTGERGALRWGDCEVRLC